MTHRLFAAIVVSILLSIVFPARAQTCARSNIHIDNSLTTKDGKRIYHTEKLKESPPIIDGKLTEEVWKQGKWSGNFRQYLPSSGDSPSQDTYVKVLYDEENIYVAIRAFDNEPEKIDKKLGRRDAFGGDVAGVCFDSYFDHRTAFEFSMTAAGNKRDMLVSNSGSDASWDAVWYGQVGYEDSAWVVEMQIPLSQLRFGDKEKQVWGMHVWRWINRNQEQVQWNLVPRDGTGLLYSVGELHGLEGIKSQKNIEVTPYTVVKGKSYVADPDNPFSDGFDPAATIGFDAKYGITSDFTVDLTVNPDFGQVEADPSQLNLSAYETYLRERRPFFLEGKNILDYNFDGSQLFYSRRIGQSPHYSPDTEEGEYFDSPNNTAIIGAAKVTGKTKNGLSIGIIESVTRKETATIKSASDEWNETVEPLTNYFVARVQKDVNKGNSYFGGILTSVQRNISEEHLKFMNKSALTAGFDLKHQWQDKKYYFELKSVFSNVQGDKWAMSDLQNSSARYFQRPDAEHLDFNNDAEYLRGYGIFMEIGKGSKGRWRYEDKWVIRSAGLELNDMGFMAVTDRIKHRPQIEYVINEPFGIFRQLSTTLRQKTEWTTGGEYLFSSYEYILRGKFKNKWSFWGNLHRVGSGNSVDWLRGGPKMHRKAYSSTYLSVNTDRSKRIQFNLRFFGKLGDDKITNHTSWHAKLDFRITNSLNFRTDFKFSESTDFNKYVDQQTDSESDKMRYIMSSLDRKTTSLTLRLDYAISPYMTIQYYASPYISVGKHYDFKHIIDAQGKDYFASQYAFSASEITKKGAADNSPYYAIDEGSTGIENYSFSDPDFNFREFNSNLVFRWEYRPGSSVYLVWTHGHSAWINTTNMSISDNVGQFFDNDKENVFLVKLNYWFSK